MPVWLLKYLPHLIGLVAVVGGLWYFSHVRYNAGYDKSQAEVAEQVAKATAETARIDAERAALAQRIESDLLPKLDAASKRGDSLARRLWAYSHSSPLPQAPGSTPSADGPGGVPGGDGGVEQATGRLFAACARDATRLNGWIEFYGGLTAPPPYPSGPLPIRPLQSPSGAILRASRGYPRVS